MFLSVYSLAFSSFALITADPDLWGHIKFGKELWLQKSFPTTNQYSYTAPNHPWINHEWLAELIFYTIYNFFGSTGLLLFKCLFGQLLVHIIYQYNLKREAHPLVLTGIMMLTVPVLAPGFMVRPHLWTSLFFAVFILLLLKGIEEKKGALYWIPFLMLVWVNCHGGVVAGVSIFTIVLLVESARSLLSGEKFCKPLLISYFISCFAVLLNPSGLILWKFFYHSLSQPRNITEWNPIPLFNGQFIFLKILAVLFFASLFLPVKKSAWKTMLLLGTIYFGFKHQRHSVLAAISLATYLPVYLSKGLAPLSGTISKTIYAYRLNSPTKFLLSLFIIFQIMVGVSKYKQNEFKLLVEPQVYPSYLVKFMRKNKLNGNLQVPFDWGEYFIWKLPDSKVSIDGRFRTAYPESVIRWGQQVYSELPPAIIEKYQTDFIIVRKNSTTKNYLKDNKEWVKIYEDLISNLFMSKNRFQNLKPGRKWIQPKAPPSLNFP